MKQARHRRPFDYDPPEIKWIEVNSGLSHAVPLPDPNASNLYALRYLAALITARSEVDCRIGQLNGPDVYDYVVYAPKSAWAQSGNCGSYDEARSFLYGIEVGAKAMRQP